jgi:hypothetical protein
MLIEKVIVKFHFSYYYIMVQAQALEEVLIPTIPELSEENFCPDYATIWNHNSDEFKKNQLGFGICEKYNTLMACAMYPTYEHQCDRSKCIHIM